MALKVVDLDAKKAVELSKKELEYVKKDERTIGEYTLSEIKTYCNNTICDKCDPKIREFCEKLLNNEGGYMPAYWDLDDKLSNV